MQKLQAVPRGTLRLPHIALEPQAFALEAAEHSVLQQAEGLAADLFRLTSCWYIDFIIQHLPTDRKTRYTARLAQAENYGVAFSLASALEEPDRRLALQEDDHALVGEDGRALLKDRRYRSDMDRTALIDVVAGHLSDEPSKQVTVDQKRRDKYAVKSRLFADETELVLRRKGSRAIKASKPHIHVIGAMAGTHAALLARGFEVTAADMSPDVIGQNLGGVTVCDDTQNSKLIEAADLVIMTGMTFPNRTLPKLTELAKTNNTSTMIWAVTGRNLGPYYTRHGIDCVISDPAPFLSLPGPATIGVWRREI
jgi:putative heavy-metal chelation protein